jgi:hypothetical protein
MADLESTNDQHALTLLQMCGVVSLAAGNVDTEPLGAFLTLATGTGAHLVDGDPETSDCAPLVE